MKKPHGAIVLFPHAQLLLALFAALVSPPETSAQPGGRPVAGRFLLIFDTSSDMKRRLPAVESAVNRLFDGAFRGEMRRGDTIGVWTLNADLDAGRFPLQHWDEKAAAATADAITTFVETRRYRGKADWAAALPLLNRLVADSKRLTVLFFCDGREEIQGTPFDAGINRIFAQQWRARGKARAPFILALRSQLGKYVGCTVSFPPAPMNFPQFPPLPAPPPAKPAHKPQLPPPPTPVQTVHAVQAPPLILVGTNVKTNLPPSAPKLQTTNAPPTASEEKGKPTTTNAANAGHPALNAITTHTNAIPSSAPPPPPAPRPSAIKAPPPAAVASKAGERVSPPAPQPRAPVSAQTPSGQLAEQRGRLAAIPVPSLSHTNTPPAPPPRNFRAHILAGAGAGLLLLAGGLAVLVLRRVRGSRLSGSLITRAIKKN